MIRRLAHLPIAVCAGHSEDDAPQLMGLGGAVPEIGTEPLRDAAPMSTLRGKSATLRGVDPDLAGTLRPACGDPAAPVRGASSPRKPGKTAANRTNTPVVAPKARSRRVNGHAAAQR